MTKERKAAMAAILKVAGATYCEIAEVFHLSPQRIQQLIAGTDHPQHLAGWCSMCGKQDDHLHRHHDDYSVAEVVLLCASCHGKTKKIRTGKWTRMTLVVVEDTGTFANKLKSWRDKRTQRHAASLLKIPFATYRKYEANSRTPNKLALAELERRMERKT